MAKRNCWEVMKCGREPGGSKVGEKGVCPTALAVEVDGMNCGHNGGRACWAISGTLCKGKVQGEFALKYRDCRNCNFYKLVKEEEGIQWRNAKEILKKIKDVA